MAWEIGAGEKTLDRGVATGLVRTEKVWRLQRKLDKWFQGRIEEKYPHQEKHEGQRKELGRDKEPKNFILAMRLGCQVESRGISSK